MLTPPDNRRGYVIRDWSCWCESLNPLADATIPHVKDVFLHLLVVNLSLRPLSLFQDINFWGYVYMTYHALEHLKRSNGQIVVNSSVSSIVPQPRNSIYNVRRLTASSYARHNRNSRRRFCYLKLRLMFRCWALCFISSHASLRQSLDVAGLLAPESRINPLGVIPEHVSAIPLPRLIFLPPPYLPAVLQPGRVSRAVFSSRPWLPGSFPNPAVFPAASRNPARVSRAVSLTRNIAGAVFVTRPRFPGVQASKAAVTNFFHTLRIELGDSVPITIFSPGVTKSELSDGKMSQAEGKVPGPEKARDLRNVRKKWRFFRNSIHLLLFSVDLSCHRTTLIFDRSTDVLSLVT